MIPGGFGVVDYIVCVLILGISGCIGIFFMCIATRKRNNTADEYLYGEKKMHFLPVGLSLYSSSISTITIIGMPIEVYFFGTQYLIIVIAKILGIFIVWFIILPVFCGNLNINTPYEYFEKRFNTNVKLLSSVIYIIQTLLLMPVFLYAPSMALSQTTGFSVYGCVICVGAVCIFYTAFGGYKAVIWTDAIQATLMILSCLLIVVISFNQTGSFDEVWTVAETGKRITFFNMDPNPFVRSSFWSVLIGGSLIHTCHYGCSAGALQRYMSLPSEKQARISTIVGTMGSIFISVIGGVTGLIMYAQYKDCDPVLNKVITQNQLVPYFAAKTVNHIPGFLGFFIAGLLSAALSTLSSELNVVGGIIYYDFLRRYFKSKFIKNNGTLLMKIIIILNGILYMLLIPLMQQSRHIYELAISLTGIIYGAKLGLIILGILFPKSNSKGVISGALISIIVMIWISYSANAYKVNSFYKLETSTKTCFNNSTKNVTITNRNFKEPQLDDIFILYRLSYLYYTLFGTLITVTIALIISAITNKKSITNLDPLLVAPFLRSYVQKNNRTDTEMK